MSARNCARDAAFFLMLVGFFIALAIACFSAEPDFILYLFGLCLLFTVIFVIIPDFIRGLIRCISGQKEEEEEEECQIEITSVSTQTACPNQKITFVATSDTDGTINWRGGGQPPTGSGNSFTTAFNEEDIIKMVWVTLTTESGTCSDVAGVMIKKLSGADCVDLFPKSDLISDLEPGFGNKVQAFYDQLQSAGAHVQIDTTYRPPERAYLMHYSYRIANGAISPQNVPYYPGVEICWVHRDENGNIDESLSIFRANQMVNAYEIVHLPVLESRHTERLAIDMNITWSGNLEITDGNGDGIMITTTPRTGAGNSDLHAVGATYGVIKLVSDKPHWSSDGH